MKRVLFIDRDGTVIVEPPVTFQVDSLEKLEFYPKVIRNLHRIAAEMPFELVMVTNQDGLGTTSFPEETFRPPHLKMLTTLAGEGIEFAEILIDRSFEYENAPTRKPRTGLLRHYLNNPEYDLANSYVIGDRPTDMELAYNLGAKGILVGSPTRDWTFANEKVEEAIVLISPDWDEIYEFLHTEQTLSPSAERAATHQRKTLETHISLQLNLDGEGRAEISTGIGFFDHMLEQIAKHARIDLTLHAKGDLHIEAHHTIEDVGIALGEAFVKALGNKRGIERYGFAILPMDESLAQVAIDFSGRPWLMWQGAFRREMLGDYPTEMTQHFFKSFSDNAKCNLNIKVEGENDHHQTEIIYKAFAKAVRNAIRREANNFDLPSTKGVL